MIKIDSTPLLDKSEKYAGKMLPIVKENYENLKSTDISVNPFTNKPYIKFFERANKFEPAFVNFILIGQIVECKKFRRLHNYINTAKIALYGNFKIDSVLNDKGKKVCKINRIEERKNFIQAYENDWIISDIANNPNFFENAEKFQKLISTIADKMEILNKLFEKVIGYDNLSHKLRHEVLSSLGVEVCPYCNRQYITNYKDDNDSVHTTADLDHFLPKSKFTLFSLSLFNFVPL